jgi:TonB family protein
VDWHSNQPDEDFEAQLRQFQPPAPPALAEGGTTMNAAWIVAVSLAAASAVPAYWIWNGSAAERRVTAPAAAPAAPAAAGQADSPRPLRVGVDIEAPPLKVFNVDPVYPQEAQAQEVEGTVVAHIIIAADGSVRNAQVVKSIPLLDQAALDAVVQWEFEPTLLNGQPVEVEMDVFLRFTLS